MGGQAVMIPHHSLLANVIQMAHFTKANDDSRPEEMQRYKPGDKCLGREYLLDLRPCDRTDTSWPYSATFLPYVVSQILCDSTRSQRLV